MKLRKFPYVLLLGGWAIARAADLAATTPPDAAAPVPAANLTAPISDIVHVGGSDMLQTAVGEPLTRFAHDAHLNVKVDMRGSVPALSGLKEGSIQLAVLVAPLGQAAAPAGYKIIPLCFAVDYLIVNPANPLNSLDVHQLAGVFGQNELSINTWGDLQASADWIARRTASRWQPQAKATSQSATKSRPANLRPCSCRPTPLPREPPAPQEYETGVAPADTCGATRGLRERRR